MSTDAVIDRVRDLAERVAVRALPLTQYAPPSKYLAVSLFTARRLFGGKRR